MLRICKAVLKPFYPLMLSMTCTCPKCLEGVKINWECASFRLAGPSEQSLPKSKARNSLFPAALVLHVRPENVGSLKSHLLFPAGITGADILHPYLLRAGDRWADLKLGPGELFHSTPEVTKTFSLKTILEFFFFLWLHNMDLNNIQYGTIIMTEIMRERLISSYKLGKYLES